MIQVNMGLQPGSDRNIIVLPRQLSLLDGENSGTADVALTDDIRRLLAENAVVAVGVSGGKDSQACAIAVDRHLRGIGHTGPRVLIHADLGSVEWRDSLPCCERLAARLGWELIVVRRAAGGLLERWKARWNNNVARYRDLACVKLILPWSTPAMRFCTSELKVDVITRALKKRFPGQGIINVAGIRRQESTARSRMPIAAPEAKLARKGCAGFTWNAIIEWPVEQVFTTVADAGLVLHEAYMQYGCSRVSCAYCIMASGSDLAAAASCADNQGLYVEMVELEARSTFAFQGSRWLADVAPQLLDADLRQRIARAKVAASVRQQAEASLPAHLLYTSGWPTVMPTRAEAERIADVRRQVAAAVVLEIGFTCADSIVKRYAELLGARNGVRLAA